jgi:hypothetical protein
MSSEFAEELGEPLRMGIGIHDGPTIGTVSKLILQVAMNQLASQDG